MELKEILESVVFAAERPLTLKQLQDVTSTPKKQIEAVLKELAEAYEDHGIQLAEVGGGYQFRTHPEASRWVKRLLAGRPQRLTRPMLETLAITAYQQPVTRPEIEDIRGVDCGGTLRVLLERKLVRIVGKKEEVGRPLLYGTTKQFLEFFHLASLKELPTLREFAELSAEHEARVDLEFGQGEAAFETPEFIGEDPIEGPLREHELAALAEARAEAKTRRIATLAEQAKQHAAQTAQVKDEDAENEDAETSGDTSPSAAPPTPETSETSEPPKPTDEDLEIEEAQLLASLDNAIHQASTVIKQGQAPTPKPSEEGDAKEGDAKEGDAQEGDTQDSDTQDSDASPPPAPVDEGDAAREQDHA